MKHLVSLFFFLISFCFGAHGQTAYNAIATAYVVTTISQNVVFDSTMQQGGTFNFSVLAHNGGGRAGQSDTANVRIQYFTAGGQQVGATEQSSYNANLPNPNAVCGNPCIDTAVPWSTLTISSTLSAAQAATVAYAKVSMYGIDGSYWAGDYGPWYRAPTLQLNGGSNLLYNPEFGPYNGVTAQGWTSSPGFGACQGAWGGSNACIVNSDGVPGQSTTGLVANANGGGPSATGGTTNGTPGGYNSTMSTTNAGTGATAGPPPVTYTTTYSTQTSSKIFGNRTITYSIPVKTVTNNSTGAATTSPVTPATLPTGHISNVVYNSGGGWEFKNVTYTATKTGTGYIMFAFRNDPNYWVLDNVSVKANNTGANLLVNGGLEQSGMMTVNVGGVQQTVAAPTGWGLAYQTNQSKTLGGGYDSGMWYDTSTGSFGAIYQNVNFTAGVTYTITFMVASDYNANGDTVQMGVYAGSCDGESTACALPASTGMTTAVKPSETYTVGCTTDCPAPPAPTLCCGGSSAPFNADALNTAKVMSFVNRTTQDSQVYITQIGNQNTITVDQSGTRNNYFEYNGNGSNNTITATQTGTGATQANYIDLTVNGNSNNVNISQQSTGGAKGAFVTIQDNNNSLILQQKDSGSHYAEVSLSGGNKNVDILQQGSASHMARVGLTGLPVDLSLTQTGSTQNFYSINFNCATVGGCAKITVQQGQ
jgi:hypothetical protein